MFGLIIIPKWFNLILFLTETRENDPTQEDETKPSEIDNSDGSLTPVEDENEEAEEKESINEGEEVEAEDREEDQDEEGDDGDGWITCKNVKKHKAKKNFFGAPEEEKEEEKDAKVACITGDFAVQVCLLKGSKRKVGKDL